MTTLQLRNRLEDIMREKPETIDMPVYVDINMDDMYRAIRRADFIEIKEWRVGLIKVLLIE